MVRTRSQFLAAAAVLVGCASVAPPEAQTAIPIGSPAARLEGTRYLQYRVGINIKAPASKIWALLTDAPAYPQWNSTIIKIDGKIALEETIELQAKIDPERTFSLKVSVFDAPKKLVWGDGGSTFKGVRTFLLTPRPDGSVDLTMAEVLTGSFMGMIADKLPDFRPSFDVFAADLKRAAEGAP